MAYMSTTAAAKIRADLKEAFPPADGWKLSVKKSSGDLGIAVTFMAGPFRFEQFARADSPSIFADRSLNRDKVEPMTNCDINRFHVDSLYPKATAKVLNKALAIILKEHWDKSDISTDYFHCAFYVDLGVGRWDSPYVHKAPDMCGA